MNHVDNAFDEAAELYGIKSGIILGDFNADCGFLSQKSYRELDLVKQSALYTWIIGSDVDTTTKKSTNCAYDRFAFHLLSY